MCCSYLQNFWNFYNEIISRVFLSPANCLVLKTELSAALPSFTVPAPQSAVFLCPPVTTGQWWPRSGVGWGRCRAPLSQHYHPTSIHMTELFTVLPSVALLPHRGPNVKRVKHRIITKTWHHKSPKIALCEVNKIWGKLKHRHKVLFFQYFSLLQQFLKGCYENSKFPYSKIFSL